MSRPPKVLHITPAFFPARAYGGPVEAVHQLCRALAGRGCEIRVLTTDADGPDTVLAVDVQREIEMAHHLHVRYCRRSRSPSLSWTLFRLMPAYVRWADIVHLTAVYSSPTIPALWLSRRLGRPVVWSPRGALQRWEGSTRRRSKALWEAVCGRAAPRQMVLHATSEREADDSRARFPGFDAAVIPNGVEIPQEVTRLPSDGALRLLFLGRLHPIKGIENLLAACRLLQDAGRIRWALKIAGAGDAEYAERLGALVIQLGLSPHVRLLGHVVGDVKRRLFEDTDVVVVPSHSENFGLVVAEALAHGVPVVASTGTPWQEVEREGCGLWVSNHPGSLAAAVEHMSRLPLRAMGERGREWVAEQFAWDVVAVRMLEQYAALLGDAGTEGSGR